MNSVFFRSRYLVFAGLILLTAASGALALRGFTIDNSVGIWFAQDDTKLKEYEQYLEQFGHQEWTILMVETGSLGSPRFIKDLVRLTDRLEGLEHVSRVVSLVKAPGLEPGVRDGAQLMRGMRQHPLFKDLLLRPGDHRRTVLLLQTDNFIGRQDPYRIALVDDIHTEVERCQSVTDHSLAGTSVINAELNRSARRDMFVFFSLVTLLVFAFSLVMFRSLRDAAVLLSVAASTVVFTMGLIAAWGYSLNMVTIMLPTVLIALSVADVIHVIHTFHRVRHRSGPGPAVGQTVRRVWLPCLGTALTTMVGFLSLSGSGVLPIFQLAVFGCCGIAMALVVSLGVAPLMLYQLWRGAEVRVAGSPHDRSRFICALACWIRRWPRAIVLGFVLTGGALGGLWVLEADTNYAEFFRSSSRVPRDYDRIGDAGFPQNPLVLTLAAPAGQSGISPLPWAAVARFEERLRRLPEVKNVIAPREGIDPLELVSRDRRRCQVILMTGYLSSKQLNRLTREVRRLKRALVPGGVRLGITGTTVLWASMDSQIVRTQVTSVLVVSVAMLLVLAVIFRSLWLAALGWLVSAFPVAIILGLMGLLGVKMNMATVLIAGIALGIAVDDTIHLIFAFGQKIRQGHRPQAAVEQALSEIGPRLVLTTVILVGGFGSMITSQFLPTANFGLFSCLTIIVALLTDLILLPVLLGRRGWFRSWRGAHSAGTQQGGLHWPADGTHGLRQVKESLK